MKKILALLLAFTMLFAFAACGGNGEDETTAPETTTDLFAEFEDDTTVAPAEENTDVSNDASASDVDASVADTSVDASASEAESTEAANPNALNSKDTAEVVAFYLKAYNATNPAPKGHSTMKLDGSITGDGALGSVLKIASPIIESTLEKNSVETDYVPGKGKLTAADVTKAQAVSKNGVTEITMQLKDQTDGPEADPHTAGPVARGIGTLGNINNAIESLGAELYSGRETIQLTYTNAYIKCKVDENTGKIIGGDWHYSVKIFVGNAEIKLGLKFTAKNLRGCVDYTVHI